MLPRPRVSRVPCHPTARLSTRQRTRREQLQRTVDKFRDAALSTNTKRAYKSAARRYLKSCVDTGHSPWPVTLSSVTHWHATDWLLRKNARSIKQDGLNLSAYCANTKLGFLVAEGEKREYKVVITGMQNLEVREVKRPAHVSANDLLNIAATVNTDDPRDMQLWLMLLVARTGLLRASELCGDRLKREHLHDEGQGAWRIDIFKTKTTRRSADAQPFWVLPANESATLSPRQNILLDTAALLSAYIQQANLTTGAPLFPRLDKHGRAERPYKPMSYNYWLGQFKTMCKRANIQPRSLHALRAGGATDLYIQGVDEAMIKKAGRWVPDSTSTLLYNRPGSKMSAIVQRAHVAELEDAARTRSGRQR